MPSDLSERAAADYANTLWKPWGPAVSVQQGVMDGVGSVQQGVRHGVDTVQQGVRHGVDTVQQGVRQGVAAVRDTTKNVNEVTSKNLKDAASWSMDAVKKTTEAAGSSYQRGTEFTAGTGGFVLHQVGKGTSAAKHALQAAVIREPAAPSGRRHVLESALLLKASADGFGDVHVRKLVAAGGRLCDCLEKLGPFAVFLRDVRRNLQKLEQSPARRGEEPLKGLLRAEVAQGVQVERARLEDNSAAMGLLWTVRFMRFWREVCAASLRWREAERSRRADAEEHVPFRLHVKGAYEAGLQQHHGKVGSSTFKLALPAIPKEWLHEQLAPSAPLFWADCALWVDALETILTRCEAIIKKLELRDDRTTA
mmetsp:Transcript_8775/g.19458  ORF Transcript_8775/g.19458 Transcript_8775/m.19458 type:complete len:366 (-) Transcript_8775:486-1583(-)